MRIEEKYTLEKFEEYLDELITNDFVLDSLEDFGFSFDRVKIENEIEKLELSKDNLYNTINEKNIEWTDLTEKYSGKKLINNKNLNFINFINLIITNKKTEKRIINKDTNDDNSEIFGFSLKNKTKFNDFNFNVNVNDNDRLVTM